MAERDMDAELQQLRDDFSSLQNDVAEITSLLREMGEERIDRTRESAAERMRATREQLRRRADAARARGQEAVNEVEETIGGHPLSSVTMAFGIGFLVAKLIDIGSKR